MKILFSCGKSNHFSQHQLGNVVHLELHFFDERATIDVNRPSNFVENVIDNLPSLLPLTFFATFSPFRVPQPHVLKQYYNEKMKTLININYE